MHNHRSHYPDQWVVEAHCIHSYETGLQGLPGGYAWSHRWDDGNNASSRGGFQFLYSTWASVVSRHRLRGYPVDPARASREQQLFAAWLLYLDDGRSWHEWSTAKVCGLT